MLNVIMDLDSYCTLTVPPGCVKLKKKKKNTVSSSLDKYFISASLFKKVLEISRYSKTGTYGAIHS